MAHSSKSVIVFLSKLFSLDGTKIILGIRCIFRCY
nr:MAG TPA: hypothetical protein [Caudoviricetes sp.]